MELKIPDFPIVGVAYCHRCGEFIRIIDYGRGEEEEGLAVLVICPDCGAIVEELEAQ